MEEMDKFLEKYSFPKLSQEEMENLNRLITSKETETVIRYLPENKSPGPDASQLNSTQNLEKIQHLSFSNASKQLQSKECSQVHSMKPTSP